MSAVALALQLVGPGGRVLAAHDCYGGTYRLLRALEARGQIELCFTNLTAPTAEAEIARCAPAMVWVETPSNPLLRITDVRAVCAAARRVGAIAVVDNTFLSPALQRPITLGADVVVHSTTKYLNGHSDVVGGAVIAKDPAHLEKLGWWANCLGLTGAPFDSYLTLRGVRTLFPRVRAHEENAQIVARVLDEHPAVIAVHYPGLKTHPGHALATAQQDGYGAMISFEVAGGEGAVRELTAALQCFTLAESLGGVESLVAHPATMTHASMDAEARRIAGIGDGLLRLSVGIEDILPALFLGFPGAAPFERETVLFVARVGDHLADVVGAAGARSHADTLDGKIRMGVKELREDALDFHAWCMSLELDPARVAAVHELEHLFLELGVRGGGFEI